MNQSAGTRAAIAAMGDQLGPEVLQRCTALFNDEQTSLAAAVPPALVDAAYGSDPRQRLDLYRPSGESGPLPVLLFVHGGGFRMGDKGSATSWNNANVGRMAARAGFLGAVMTYRLAPAFQWPSGGEDVGAAIEWLRANAAANGGDPERIVVAGTSAGAVHIGAWLQQHPGARDVRGAVLLSGLYGVVPLEERDLFYFGEAGGLPLEAVTETTLPLLLASAEFDPPRFQAEFVGLLARRLERHGRLPRAYVASGHNHYSMAMHLGSSDDRLAQEIIAFAREVCA